MSSHGMRWPTLRHLPCVFLYNHSLTAKLLRCNRHFHIVMKMLIYHRWWCEVTSSLGPLHLRCKMWWHQNWNHPVLVPAVLLLLGKAVITDIASFLGSLGSTDSSRQEKSSWPFWRHSACLPFGCWTVQCNSHQRSRNLLLLDSHWSFLLIQTGRMSDQPSHQEFSGSSYVFPDAQYFTISATSQGTELSIFKPFSMLEL